MLKRPACFLVLLLAPVVSPAQSAPQVDQDEVRRLGNVVQQLGVGPQSDGVDDFLTAMGPPASDADKWFISLVTIRNCAPCVQLKQAFGTDPWLKALADPNDPKKSWSHFGVYDVQDRSQSFRFEKLKIEAYPTILVQPPRSKKYGEPSTVVFQGTYGGDPKKLATEITTAVRRYVAKLSEAKSAREPAAIGDIGADPPWQPAPKVDPVLPVLPTPPVDVVQIPPPLPTPVPAPSPSPAPTPAPAPNSVPSPASMRLEAVVVTDADTPTDDATETRIREVIQGLKRERGQHLKVRRVDWQDAVSRYPLRRDEVPVVLVTSDGRIEDKISASLLPFVDAPAKPVSLTDLPWSVIAGLVTTGFSVPALAALAVWALGMFRTKKQQAGQPPVLSDAAFQQLLDWLKRLEQAPTNTPSAS
jgi:hypothetical protein